MHTSSNDRYRYLDELNLLKQKLYTLLEGNIEILKETFSNKHITQPASLEAFYEQKDYHIFVNIDSGIVNAVIKKGNAEIALHRYLLNKKKYNREKHKLDGTYKNSDVIEWFLNELEIMLTDSNLYFYVWEGEKRYKLQGDIKKKLKSGEF